MARKLRVEYPGAIYHVMNRGDRREEIFKDDLDRERFPALRRVFYLPQFPFRIRKIKTKHYCGEEVIRTQIVA